jgi:hypothetical protein
MCQKIQNHKQQAKAKVASFKRKEKNNDEKWKQQETRDNPQSDHFMIKILVPVT